MICLHVIFVQKAACGIFDLIRSEERVHFKGPRHIRGGTMDFIDYSIVVVIRDTRNKLHQTYVALPNGRNIVIDDNGCEKVVESLPKTQPDNTPLKDKEVFRIHSWPYNALATPPLSVVTRIQKLIADAGIPTEQKSAS